MGVDPSVSFGEIAPFVAEAVVAGLRAPGWIVIDHALASEHVAALLDDLLARGSFVAAGVGRGDEYQQTRSVRSDRIEWIEPDTPVAQAYLAWAESWRLLINRHLFLGLFEFEAHYATYPPGGFYRRHLDAFRGGGNRKVSTVLYLDDWRPGDGGELVIFEPAPDDEAGDPFVVEVDPTTPVLATVEPIAGRLVVFLSEEIPHEVLPTNAERHSIAGWYRVA